MEISVIIPTYRPQNYIWECLNSLKNQTFPKEDFEVILVLNGCNEPYCSQIKEYIGKNLIGYNVNFIRTDQGGVSNARNIGLDNATGKYIAFIDDDDYVSPQYLELLYKNTSCNIVSLSYPYAFYDGSSNQIKYGITEEYKKRKEGVLLSINNSRKFFSGPCMKLIHKDIIGSRRFDKNLKNGEDSVFMFLISDRIKHTILSSNKAIYYRRYRKDSAVTRKRSRYEIIKNSIILIVQYFKITIYSPNRYNLKFFTTRILGAIKTAISSQPSI